MAPTEDSSPDVAALRELLQSDGWRLFQALIEQEWGAAATLRKIDHALVEIPRGDRDAVNDTVQQIQASRREVLKVLGLPQARVSQLAPEEKSKQPFAALRRMGR